MKRKVIAVLILAVGLAISIFGFVKLPESVVVQIDMEGKPSNYMPKSLAVIIPLALVTGGAFLMSKDNKNFKKYLVVSIIGILVMIVILVANLTAFTLPM